MKVNILASGSGGNCIALRSGDTTILVDAGIPKTKIEKRLLEVGIRPDEIKAIFITHAHKDHICGLPLANKYKIPVYASEGEWKEINSVDEDLFVNLGVHDGQLLGDDAFPVMEITSFDVHHDALEPKGYVLYDGKTKVSICLDTGKVDEEMLEAMKGSNIYIIEANHDEDMVEASDYPRSVKARILSHIGHLSNLQTANALTKLVRGLGEKIYLTHLSTNNNLPALAEGTVKRALAEEGLKAGEDYEIEVI
ncbi:MBL fold metallo-hydrolase [Halalkalibacterium halodurans]|uniref:Beta-lactamase n=1 Tax=Halalkalibacterium halodurans TaxID=86665 RepID=A0A0M0KJE2_ALKHA|nr:MBL fold metallo-hydrolase [Halalkalibacterium halodurans]TPE67998.1 MBL fold metallo-hydrolase [Halalkalibacterium halodurans]